MLGAVGSTPWRLSLCSQEIGNTAGKGHWPVGIQERAEGTCWGQGTLSQASFPDCTALSFLPKSRSESEE